MMWPMELHAGGPAIHHIPEATRLGMIDLFPLTAERRLPVYTHVRSIGRVEPGSSIESVSEVIGRRLLRVLRCARRAHQQLQVMVFGNTPEVMDKMSPRPLVMITSDGAEGHHSNAGPIRAC